MWDYPQFWDYGAQQQVAGNLALWNSILKLFNLSCLSYQHWSQVLIYLFCQFILYRKKKILAFLCSEACLQRETAPRLALYWSVAGNWIYLMQALNLCIWKAMDWSSIWWESFKNGCTSKMDENALYWVRLFSQYCHLCCVLWGDCW